MATAATSYNQLKWLGCSLAVYHIAVAAFTARTTRGWNCWGILRSSTRKQQTVKKDVKCLMITAAFVSSSSSDGRGWSVICLAAFTTFFTCCKLQPRRHVLVLAFLMQTCKRSHFFPRQNLWNICFVRSVRLSTRPGGWEPEGKSLSKSDLRINPPLAPKVCHPGCPTQVFRRTIPGKGVCRVGLGSKSWPRERFGMWFF